MPEFWGKTVSAPVESRPLVLTSLEWFLSLTVLCVFRDHSSYEAQTVRCATVGTAPLCAGVVPHRTNLSVMVPTRALVSVQGNSLAMWEFLPFAFGLRVG
jgi:hypothetical protein